MRIVADENIPFIKEACRDLGEVVLVPGRAMDKSVLNDADCLLVRSVTKVNHALLDGTSVRFVATATIGTDHVDTVYLDSAGIGFASAPGSNANSVSEYVISALLCLAQRHGFHLTDKTIGVIGVGNVGTRVAHKAEALGMRVLCNDPPRAAVEGEAGFVSLETLLAQSDIVTMHTPLEQHGAHPTFHLANDAFFSTMKRGAIFINSSRGKVHDSAALLRAIKSGIVAHAVLDVWEHEPLVDEGLLRAVDLASPHVAGYSFDGKVNGTVMVVNAAREYFRQEGRTKPTDLLPDTFVPQITIDATDLPVEQVLLKVTRSLFDSRTDDDTMRWMLTVPQEERAAFFDTLRREYRVRREFIHSTVLLPQASPVLEKALIGLGFRVSFSGE